MTNNVYPSDVKEWPNVEVYNSDFRPSLLNMANAITKLDLWNWMKEYSPEKGCGFMYSDNPNIYKIGGLVDSDGHSGATFGYSMRCMEMIAKEGFDKFKESCKKPS